MIKLVIFDLDNTLTDFVRMKEVSIEAAIQAMIDAGLLVPPDRIREKIHEIYAARSTTRFSPPGSSATGVRAKRRSCSTRTCG
jgi:beta-phosphoglucomutase-like phosphatase (HAD superfamily)